ncbi:MAG: hypothetical protein MUD12_07790 [Spirochaetes bacterium]|nr:hypothetical protein [Spirochaetota bacterium]
MVKTLKEEFPDNYTEIIIKPLDGNESDTLISNLLNIRGIPQTLKDQITERAGGNPFFIEEVVRALIDEGAVVKKGDSFAVTEKIHDVKVPLTINEVLMSRIDRLDEETRNLVKTASVIGRYFFYKIIAQVAENISDIDNRLGYLEDIQLIRERKRMDELEYLFKHALAQEAAYESLLIQKRKELHLLVANAIEKVFAERLHEFYGMLAYHYSMGVNLDKTEEYMLKAGEEAMKSAASSEALEYFIQAMKLYRAKPAAMQDGKTLSYIEKCTAMALFNRGKFRDAIAYFNSYLKKKGITSYNVGIALILRSFVSLLVIVCYLFFPLLRRKKIADAADGEIFEIQLLKLVIYTYIDQKQFFFESMIYVKDVMNYDINSNVAIYKILSGTPMVFSWTGLSFTISSKIIKIIDKELINKKNTGVFLDVTARLMQYLLSGEWEKMRYDTSHVTEGLMQGEIYSQMGYLIFHSMHSYETGNFDQACLVINQLLSIADAYNFDFARVNYYRMQAKQLMKRRMIEEAMGFIPGGIDIIKKTDFKIMEILLRSFLIRLFLYKNDSSQAAELLESTRKELAKIRLVPIMYDDFLISEFYYFLQMLESASVGNDKKQYKKRLVPIIKKALGNAKKVAPDRTEIFRFVGTYCWLTGKQKKALRWWKKSIDDGERLGARLELSRTYFEVGKRILSVALDTTPQGATRATSVRSPSDSVRNRIEGSDSNIKLTKKIIGLYAGECLDKAETMFKEMGLEWDLEQLEKIR